LLVSLLDPQDPLSPIAHVGMIRAVQSQQMFLFDSPENLTKRIFGQLQLSLYPVGISNVVVASPPPPVECDSTVIQDAAGIQSIPSAATAELYPERLIWIDLKRR